MRRLHSTHFRKKVNFLRNQAIGGR